jgi:putative nucleotidyltransferase with HDIG domain
MASRILQAANSIRFGFSRKIATVDRATVILGFKAVTSLVLGISVFDNFRLTKNEMTIDLDELWKHSMGCAVAAQIISDKSGGVDRKTVLTAAILHDIGKVIMDLFFSREYAKTLTTVRNNGLSMAKAEENIMGFNHADAGGWFCDELAFPSVLVSPISFHHNVDGVDKEHELITSIVHIADNLCKRAQIGDGGDDNKNHAINLHAQRLLNLNKDDLEKITGELKGEENVN